MITFLTHHELTRMSRSATIVYWRLGSMLILIIQSAQLLMYISPDNLHPVLHDADALGIYSKVLIGQQFALVFGLTAILGAMNLHSIKSSGFLLECLITPIRAHEIVLSKWLALMVRILELGLVPLPAVILVGGIYSSPFQASLRIIVPLLWLPMVAASSVLAGISSRSWGEAITIALAVPLLVLAALGWPLTTDFDAPIPILVTITVSGLITALALTCASLRLRSVVLAHSQPESPTGWRARRSHVRPMLNDPVRWREANRAPFWFLRGLPPSIPPILFGLLFAGITLANLLDEVIAGIAEEDRGQWIPMNGIWLMLGISLLMGILSAMNINTERRQQTWSILFTTPLSPMEIFHGKIRGLLDWISPYIHAYLLAMTPVVVWLAPYQLAFIGIIWLALWTSAFWAIVRGLRHSYREKNVYLAITAIVGLTLVKFVCYGIAIMIFSVCVVTGLLFGGPPPTRFWILSYLQISPLILLVLMIDVHIDALEPSVTLRFIRRFLAPVSEPADSES